MTKIGVTVPGPNSDLCPDLAQISQQIQMPAVGMIAGSPVLTLEGALPVQFLAPGDRVITRSGSRILQAIGVNLLRDAEMIRISASALGHDRPEADLFVAPGQPILLRDWRAKALYDCDQVMIEAARLVDGEYIRAETVAEVRLYTLHFAQAEVIFTSGVELGAALTPNS